MQLSLKTMTILNPLFVHVVIIDPLLIFLFILWTKYQKSLIKEILVNPSIETVKHFLQTIEPLLQLSYRSIDKLYARTGRSPTDYRFQFRFILWWIIFKPGPLSDAIIILNGSPPLQKILGAPKNPYTRSSYYRFKKKFSATKYHQLAVWILMICLKEKFLDVSKVLMDSFPIYSFLNTQKCLKRPKIDIKHVKKFFEHLKLQSALELIPKDHKRAKPSEDKFKCLILYYIWDIVSMAKLHKTIFGRDKFSIPMGMESSWKSVATLSNYLERLKRMENFKEIEKALLQSVKSAWQKVEGFSPKQKFSSLESLNQTFYLPHRYNDKDITLNYCAAKDQSFYGRGALVIGETTSLTPLTLALTPKYKQSENSITDFLKTTKKELKGLLKGSEFIADAEFGTEKIILTIITELEAFASIEMYGNSKNKPTLSHETRKLRKRVETLIARLCNQYNIEHPQRRRTEAVDSHLQEIFFSDLLLFYYNHKIGNTKNAHSIKALRI